MGVVAPGEKKILRNSENVEEIILVHDKGQW